jgi:hypothetical protein
LVIKRRSRIETVPPKVQKPNDISVLGAVDAVKLTALAIRVSEQAWAEEDSRKENDFDVFHHTQHVIFRFIAGNRDPEDSYANPAWEIWKPVLMPIMETAIAPYGFRNPQFPKAMLAKLAAGHQIDPHYDGAGSNQRVHKIHVPLVTNPDATFLVDGRSFHLETGTAYEVNNILSHGATNAGAEDRIHFIFEVFEGDYADADATHQENDRSHAVL